MKASAAYERLDIHHIRVLYTVLTERSVSKAALILGMHQPGVSATLKRLRTIFDDPLLVLSGARMVPTEVGYCLQDSCGKLLREVDNAFKQAQVFDPRRSTTLFRVGACDFLDPLFLPNLLTAINAQAPNSRIEIHALSETSDYHRMLADGDLDVVIGNWLNMPKELHQGKLFDDEVVCLVGQNNPAVRRGWTPKDWLEAQHIAPMPSYVGAQGIIDELLQLQGLKRNIVARSSYFGLIPQMVAQTLLVLTTGRQYCSRFTSQLPLTILPCPVELPMMHYYQLWHDCRHGSSAVKWLRETIKNVTTQLRKHSVNS